MMPDSASQQRQQASEDLQAFLDAAVDAVVLIDHRGRLSAFNLAAERLFGYTAAEVLDQNVNVLMPEPDRSAHDGYLERYAATSVPHIIGVGREVTARRKDGSGFPAFLSVGVVRGSEPPRFVGFVHDMTERRQREEQGQRLQERLTHVSRLATVGEMAAGVAHELNQPLTAVANYAQACDRMLAAPAPDLLEIRGALQEIAAQTLRAGTIIRRLRSLARDDEPARMSTDINSLIEEVKDLILSGAKAQECGCRFELAAGLPPAQVDRVQIQQVLLNLIRNALEALAQPELSPREVMVGTRALPESEIEICVCDSGPGVSSSIADRMFDPFATTKPAGTGLGLAIGQTIVRAHNGALDYRPNTPKGACFCIRLPTTQSDRR